MRQTTRVFALVVTFNAPPPELVKCMSAIQAQSVRPTELLVVDNHGDQPLPADELRALGEEPVRVLRTDENLAPPAGYAAGIEVFLRTDCTHLWMLDDDVVADPDCLAELFNLLARATTGRCSTLRPRHVRRRVLPARRASDTDLSRPILERGA